jgi:hypothetical protein
MEFKEWQRQHQACEELCAEIQRTVDSKFIELTFHKDSAYEMMVALQDYFKPTTEATKLQLQLDWDKITQPQRKGTSIDIWLLSLETTFNELKRLKLAAADGLPPLLKFLNCIHPISPEYTAIWNSKIISNEVSDFNTLIRHYRDYRRFTSTQQRSGAAHSAFYATLNGRDSDGNSTANSRNQSRRGRGNGGQTQSQGRDWTRHCVCGDVHPWSRCPYFVSHVRTDGWKEDSATRKKIDSELEASAYLKAQIDTAIKASNERYSARKSPPPERQERQDSLSQQTAPQQGPRKNFMARHVTAAMSTRSVDSYQMELCNSFILDTGADGHVCNNRDRFIEFRPSITAEFVAAGNDCLDILGWGTILITAPCEGLPGGREFTISNVAFIPSFHTSVISYDILEKKGWDWRIKQQWVEHEGERFCQTPKHFNMWTLEYNPADSVAELAGKQASFETFPAQKSSARHMISEVDNSTAHAIFGHVNPEALKHLTKSCSGIRITGGECNPNCQICKLADARKQVSRLPRLYEELPFHDLCWDNISQHVTPNGESKISHLWCPFLGFHFVYVLYTGSAKEIIWTIKYTVNYIKRQYDLDVANLNIDGEQALLESNEFADWKADTGILVKVSAPDSHEQHGAAERSGGVLGLRSTKLKLEGNLPDQLWNEIYQAAGYILNRTPCRRLNWLSPLAKLHEWLGWEPLQKCHHLKPYGCKAYAYIHNRPKLDKIAAKAHIGYLIGYESTNIWRVWVPSLNRVIAVRDVSFDTSQRYSPRDELVEIDQREADQLEVPQIELSTADDERIFEYNPRLVYGVGPEHEKSIDQPGDTVVVDTGLPTPDSSPEPELQTTAPAGLTTSPADSADSVDLTDENANIRTPSEDSNNSQSSNSEPATETGQSQSRTVTSGPPVTRKSTGKAVRDIDGNIGEHNIIPDRRLRKRANFSLKIIGINHELFYFSAFAGAVR